MVTEREGLPTVSFHQNELVRAETFTEAFGDTPLGNSDERRYREEGFKAAVGYI